MRENIDAKFDAYLNLTDNDCLIVRRKNRLLSDTQQDDYKTWLDKITFFIDNYEKDKFEKFKYNRTETNDKNWNQMASKVRLLMIEPNKDKHQVIYNESNEEIIIEGLKTEIDKIKTFFDQQTSLPNNINLPLLNSDISMNKQNHQISQISSQQHFTKHEKFYYVNAYIVDFILSNPIYFNLFLKSNNLNSVIIAEFNKIDIKKIENYTDKINNNVDASESKLISIKAIDNQTIIKSYELIQNRFKIYLYNLNEKYLDLVTKRKKFSEFLTNLKQENNDYFEDMIKIDLSKNLIRIIGEKSLVDSLKDKLVEFFDTNIIITTYLNEFSCEDLKYFHICFFQELQKFSDEKSKIYGMTNIFKFENIKTNFLEMDNYKIKITSNSQFLFEFKNLLKDKLKNKISDELKLSNIDFYDVIKQNKYMNQLQSIELSNKCIIIPIKTADSKVNFHQNYQTIHKNATFNFDEECYKNDFVSYFYDNLQNVKLKIIVHNVFKFSFSVPFDAILISMNESFLPSNSFSKIITQNAGQETMNEFKDIIQSTLEDFLDCGNNWFELFEDRIFETSSGNLSNIDSIFYAVIPDELINGLDLKSYLSSIFFNFFIKCFENKIAKVAISLEYFVNNTIFDFKTVCDLFIDVLELQLFKNCCIQEIHILSSPSVSKYLLDKSENENSKIIAQPNKENDLLSYPLSFTPNSRIKIVYGSIVDSNLKVDAIVNSTSPSLELSNGIVSAIIYKMAGSQIQDELKSNYPSGLTKKKPIAVTSSGNLINLKWIFHCHITKWNENEKDILKTSFESKIHNLLSTAENYYLESIAFPALGTGTQGYPSDIICEWMFDSVKSFFLKQISNSSLKSILFVVNKDDHKTLNAFKNYEINEYSNKYMKDLDFSCNNNETDEIEVSLYENLCISTNECSLNCDDVIINVYNGDIFDTTNEILVNPTCNRMGQDGVISKLLCKKLPENYTYYLETVNKDFKGFLITDVSDFLKCKAVLHLDITSNDIENSIFEALKRLNDLGYNSVVFPPISIGSLRKNTYKICKDMLDGINSFLDFVKDGNILVNLQKIAICIFYKHGYLLEAFKEEMQVISTIQKKYNFSKNNPSKCDKRLSLKDDYVSKTQISKLKLLSYNIANIEKTKKDIEDIIKNELKTHELKNQCFNSNLDNNLREKIEKLCKNDLVKFNWDLNSHKLTLSGFNDKLFETSSKVYELVTRHLIDEKEKKDAEIVAFKVQWEFCENDKWISHNIFLNNQIEKIYNNKNTNSIEFIGDDGIIYIAEPKNMIQYRKLNVNFKLKMRRLSSKDLNISIKMPSLWFPNKDQDLILLNENEKEFIEIKLYLFNNGLSDKYHNLKKIVSIHRIQNKRLYIQYITHKEEFIKKYGNNTNEMRLFHGTALNSVGNIWKSGFNRSYAGKNATKVQIFFLMLKLINFNIVLSISSDRVFILPKMHHTVINIPILD